MDPKDRLDDDVDGAWREGLSHWRAPEAPPRLEARLRREVRHRRQARSLRAFASRAAVLALVLSAALAARWGGPRLPRRSLRSADAETVTFAIARIAGAYEQRHGQKLAGASLAIEYPPPQEVRDGEPLLLELMANADTGDKLSDVIRVSSTKTPPGEPRRLAVSKGTVKVDGEPLPESGGSAGRYIWFAVEDHGRFVLSTEPVAGYDFVPAELIDNRIIRFRVDGDTFEWASTQPVTTMDPVRQQLWVWHDAEYKVPGTFAVGTLRALTPR